MNKLNNAGHNRAVDLYLEKHARTPKGNKLSPVLEPLFNVKEIAKRMLLLEDHLCHRDKWCPDCIRKHLTEIEAFAEEALTLDKEARHPTLRLLPPIVRGWKQTWAQAEYSKTAPPELKYQVCRQLQQEIRAVRKVLLKNSFHISGSVLRIGKMEIMPPRRGFFARAADAFRKRPRRRQVA